MSDLDRKVFLSLVIPVYNEALNLQSQHLAQIENYLGAQHFTYEVVLVDDGSIDNTVELIKNQIKEKSHFRLIENSHGGKAITVMTGLLESVGEIAVFTDMDQATPIHQLEKIIPRFRAGYDIVIGSRHGRAGAPLIRKISAWGFSFLRNLILGLPFLDTQCGFKGFTRNAINQIFLFLLPQWEKMNTGGGGSAVNAGFDIETLFLAKKKNLKIDEVPVEWHFVGTERVQIIKDAFEAIQDMVRIRRNSIRGFYGRT